MEYFIKVYKYYKFDAKDNEEALAKFNDESAFNEMVIDDESPALELFTYDEDCNVKSLWHDNDN